MKLLSFISALIMQAVLNGCCIKFTSEDAKQFVNSRVLPKVKSVETNGECGFKLSKIKSVSCDSSLIAQAEIAIDKLSAITGNDIEIAKNGKLELSINKQLATEQYKLTIDNKKVNIQGGSPAGVFYGIQTLLQLLPTDVYGEGTVASDYALPPVIVDDSPRFDYRGMMIDVSRHFIQFDDLLQYVELLGQHKVNTLHLHLCDDQGWRLEIKAYPELTKIGSIRGTNEVIKPFRHSKAPEWQKHDPDPYGPFFYTQEQIKQLIKFASVRGITIVPEIDVPGHSLAINRVLHTGCRVKGSKGVHGYRGNVLCAGNEEVFNILETIFAEVAALFPSDYIHIGGDEVNHKQWLSCSECKKLMKREKLKGGHEIQNYVVKRVCEIVAKHGKRPVGWNEILSGGKLPEGTTIMSWIGPKPGIEAAKKGIEVIMAPGQYCYFDMKEARHHLEPGHWWAGIVNLEKVYSFDPLESIPDENKSFIKGISGALWTEYVTPEKEQLHYKSFPRLCALAEVAWSQPEHREYSDFMSRMGKYHLLRLEEQDVNYRIPRATYKFENDSIVFTKPYPEAKIYYSIDGSKPSKSSQLYEQPIPMKYRDDLKFITLSPSGKACKYEGVIKKDKKKK
ncbi:hypothetical protein EYV94_18080 [Puteibacter caeruleilacunae]|nr:hypothetical protein EYV94_18080 [Puteibacter caeruleilacunae]